MKSKQECATFCELLKRDEPFNCPGVAAALLRAGVGDYPTAKACFAAAKTAAEGARLASGLSGEPVDTARAIEAAMAALPAGFEPDLDVAAFFASRTPQTVADVDGDTLTRSLKG